MRLIDANALKSELIFDVATTMRMQEMHKKDMALRVLNRIDEAPTIEAEPVRHGRWEWYEEWGPSTWLEPPDIINAGWKCTECGIDLGEYLTAKLHEEVYVGDMDKMPEVDRCPNCGAKMDAKEEAK